MWESRGRRSPDGSPGPIGTYPTGNFVRVQLLLELRGQLGEALPANASTPIADQAPVAPQPGSLAITDGQDPPQLPLVLITGQLLQH